MVDVMEADIAGEPLQYRRKFVERTALHTGIEIIPLAVTFPVDLCIVMLNIKHPQTGRCAKEQNQHLRD